MRHLARHRLALLALAPLLVAPPVFAAPVVIRDRTFADADWSLLTFGVGSGGTVDAAQAATAGQPAPSRRVHTVVSAAPSPTEFSVITGVSLFSGASYDPQTQGAFATLDYFEDALLELGFGDGQATGVAVRQGGEVYFRQEGSTPDFAWVTKHAPGVPASQFARIFEGGTDATAHPDFSASGGPIEFGFFRRNSTSIGANGYEITALIDNWTILINPPCTDDDDCVYPDGCFTGACVAGVCAPTALACDDGDACTIDACVDGTCGSTPLACNDGDECTTDACVAGTCTTAPVECDDGLECTADTCVGGSCTAFITFDTVEAAIDVLLGALDVSPCAGEGVNVRTREKLVRKLTKARDKLALADEAVKERLLARHVGRADRLLDLALKVIDKAEDKGKVTGECADAVRSYLTSLATTCTDALPRSF